MRNLLWCLFSSFATACALSCAVDDSIAPTPSTVGSGGTAAGAGGDGSAGSATLAATGGKGGTGGAAGGSGGKAGTGGTGVGGTAGTGTGGASAGTDAGTDVPTPIADAASEVETCAPETDIALCARMLKNCGSFLALDNCGMPRAVLACGRCVDDGAVCGSGGTLNVCPGTGPVNRAQGGTVLSTNPMSPPMGAAEGDTKAFDNDVVTKWYVRGNATPSIAYDFGGTKAFVITSYTVTSGNDAPERDPFSWRLEGSNSQNLSNWTTVDTRMGETFAGRGLTKLYSFANTNAYVVYRFTVIANNGGSANGGEFQVAEIQLFGEPSPAPDAGAPDSGSTGSTDASAE